MVRNRGIVRQIVKTCGLLLFGVLPPLSQAELLYFAPGGEAQLPAVIEGATVRLAMPEGPRVLARSDFRQIVPGFCPEREWWSRLQAAQSGDVAAQTAAAWWALENGLTPQAEALVRTIHATAPKQQPAARMVAMLDRLDRPCLDPDLGPLHEALGVPLEESRGPHVVLLHQHSTTEARERIELLERVVHSYFLLMAADGLEVTVPTERFPSAWLAEESDYQAFLRAQHAGAFLTTRGYYHPAMGAVIAFDGRSEARYKRIQADLTPRPADGARDRERRELVLDLDRRALDLGTAAHELIHQLVARSGLAPGPDDFPMWLQEGFAMQFEVIRGGRWAGISRSHDLRLPDWRALATAPRIAPLLRDQGFGQGYSRDAYAQAWALVYYLRHQRPQQFLNYLDLLRTPDPTPRSRAERALNLFRTALGDELAVVESDWVRYLGALQTPLEARRPASRTKVAPRSEQRN